MAMAALALLAGGSVALAMTPSSADPVAAATSPVTSSVAPVATTPVTPSRVASRPSPTDRPTLLEQAEQHCQISESDQKWWKNSAFPDGHSSYHYSQACPGKSYEELYYATFGTSATITTSRRAPQASSSDPYGCLARNSFDTGNPCTYGVSYPPLTTAACWMLRHDAATDGRSPEQELSAQGISGDYVKKHAEASCLAG